MTAVPTIPLVWPTKHGGRYLNQAAPQQANNQQISGQAGVPGQALGSQTVGPVATVPGSIQGSGGPAAGTIEEGAAAQLSGQGQFAGVQGGDQDYIASGLGFRDIPGYGPANEAAIPAINTPIVQEQAVAQETPSAFVDENPYDDSPAPSAFQGTTTGAAGSSAYGSGFSGVQNAGVLGYDGSDAARRSVAGSLGYQQGQGDLSGLAGVVGLAAGIPGASFIADQIPKSPTEPRTIERDDGTTYTDARDRSYGAVGTTDARGNVFSQDGVAYDPVTGRRVPGVFRDKSTALPHIQASFGFEPEGYVAPPSTAAEAGLLSIAGNDSIARVLEDATVSSTPEIGQSAVRGQINDQRKAEGRSYTHYDDDGGAHEVAAGRSAVTDRHGNAVTSGSDGSVVTSVNRGGGGNDDNDSGGGGK